MSRRREKTALFMVILLLLTFITILFPSTSSQAAGYTPVLPKLPATTSIIVLDMTKDTAVDSDLYRDLQYVYLTIQGIVNRTSATKIYFTSYGAGYVGTGAWGQKNFTEAQYYLDDGLVPVPRTTPTLDSTATFPVLKYLLQNYSSYITGKVRIPGFAGQKDSAVMAGLTACAIENAIPVSDAADTVITNLGYSFTQKADTRNLNAVDAFNWAKNNYFRTETSRKVIGYNAPTITNDSVIPVYLDYLIANKAFIYGLDLQVSSNQTLTSTLINSTNYAEGTTVLTSHEAFNISDFHASSGYPIEISLVANYTVHSSFPSSSSIITPPVSTQAASLNNNNVYVSFLVTDGDAARYGSTFHYDYQRNSGNYCPINNTLPIGFTMAATAFDLFPNMLKWKSEHTNNNKWEYIADSFHGDGVPGSTQQAADNFVANYKNYMDNTNGLFKGVNFFNNGVKEKAAAANIGFNFVVRGYQGNETTTPDWQYNNSVPSVNLVAGTQSSSATNIIQAIRYAVNTVPSGQPAFVLSTSSDGGDYIYHTCSHSPFVLTNDTATNLLANPPNGRNVVFLKPSELFATWKAYKGYTSGTSTPTPTPTPAPGGTNLALNKPAFASSVETAGDTVPSKSFDGNGATRWASAHSGNPEWIYVDLGQTYNVNKVILNWEAAHSTNFKIQVSNDASAWTDIYSTTTGPGGTQTLTISGSGRYVRMHATAWSIGNSLWEFEVYGTAGSATPTPTPAPDSQAPSTPTNLASTGKTSSSVSLSWTASTDNVGVTGYEVYRSGTLAGTATGTTFIVTGLAANTTYIFTVKAKDAAGNLSAASSSLSVTTNASTSTPVKVDDNNASITYSGTWNAPTGLNDRYNATLHESSTNGSFAQYTFTGTSIKLFGDTHSWGGGADIYIDSVKVSTVSFNGADAVQQIIYQNMSLTSASHTIKIVGLGTGWVYVDALEYVN